MMDPELYSVQHFAMMATMHRAIKFIETGYPEEAKMLLELMLLAAEEADAQACEEEPNP